VCVVAQLGEKHMDFPIYYANRQLNDRREKNYKTTTKREGLAMVYVVKKYHYYLL